MFSEVEVRSKGRSCRLSVVSHFGETWLMKLLLKQLHRKDTRLNFTDHLYDAFIRSGIRCFIDNVDLPRGEDINYLFQAIQDSLCAVVVISKNYAKSTWCLDELQKFLNLKIHWLEGFFPSSIMLIQLIAKLENCFVKNWQLVWMAHQGQARSRSNKNIVGDVWSFLSTKLPSSDDNLVGIDSKVADVIPFLEIGLDDKRFVGIWGMGGVDLEIYDRYDGMRMIRSHLREKKVFLVLDDIDDISQLKDLAESPDWFGKGSRIIITTRDSDVLTPIRVESIYEMKTMRNDESLQIFSKKAFNKYHPEEKYLEYSKSVVQYAGGLPLALQALGSYLCGRSEEAVWRDALDKLKQINPHKNILQVLKISYDGLDEKEKTIFLDIVCLFKRWRKKEVTQILKACDLNPILGIKIAKFREIKEVLENNKGSEK
ncbi:hypothetical protein K1719_044796 [Acacia pycnantha]|nr:hypothetical protein K1719_044796 [Acacia pycnantha]